MLVLGVMLLGAEPLKADEWAVSGSVNQELSYDDNVVMRKNPKASLIYAITPELNFLHRTDVSEVTANASYGIQRYFDISELDRDNQNYGVNGSYFTDTTVWGLSASYGLTPSRDVAEQESGDYSTNSEKKTFRVAPSIVYQLSEQDEISLFMNYSDTGYSSDKLSDYRDWGGSLTWSRKWSERYTSSLDVFYSDFDSESNVFGQVESDSFGVNLSSTYLLSEKWTIFGTAGVRFTQTTTIPVASSNSNIGKKNSEGFLLDAGFDYKGENLTTRFNVNQSLIPTSQGQLNEQSRVVLDFNYKLTERLSASLLSSFQRSVPVDDSDGNKRTNFTVHPSISLLLTPDWVLSTSYRYRYQKRSIASFDEEANSNLYMMSLNYSWKGLSTAR